MTRIQDRLVWQREELTSNARQERLGVTTREIGPADRPSEYGVADERHSVTDQRDSAWAVARHVSDVE